MSNEVIDYEDDLSLNQHGLDFEWLRQASLYLKYSRLYADAASYRDEAKDSLQNVDAKIDLEIRSDWNDFGFENKPTEPAIKAAILQDDRHLTAADDLIKNARDMIILKGTITALEHKKAALENLSRLYLSGYWADPRITKDAQDNYESNLQDEHRSHLENNKRIK